MSDRLTVLAWHNVERTWMSPMAPGSGVRGFEAQVRKLRRVATIVPLARSLEDMRAGRPLPPRAVALTFDDGYQDNLDLAVPILERYGLPATFFLVPGLLNRKVRHVPELLNWAYARSPKATIEWRGRVLKTRGRGPDTTWSVVGDSLRPLPWAELEPAVDDLLERLEPVGDPAQVGLKFMDGDGAAELVRRGFEIGSHTMRHAVMANEDPSDQRRDMAESKVWLERALDVPVTTLAYPFGRTADFGEAGERAAEAAGYGHAFSTQLGVNTPSTSRHAMHRIALEPNHGFSWQVWRRVVWLAERKLRR
jgi:peptidoglycan/xylan/chitin deacetylase (PgdA/CDA1 family)